MAVLAAIAVKVGVDILDWSFLKRAHRVSRSAMAIMYGVMGLTVFVDLIVAVGVGVFVANILTIDRLSRLQQQTGVRAIDTSEDELPVNAEEKELFVRADGEVLLLHLSGPMIFGVAKAIAREQEELTAAKALVLDLNEVPILSTTVALALENVVRQAQAANVAVYICAREGETRERLERVGKSAGLRSRFCESRVEALREAVEHVERLHRQDRATLDHDPLADIETSHFFADLEPVFQGLWLDPETAAGHQARSREIGVHEAAGVQHPHADSLDLGGNRTEDGLGVALLQAGQNGHRLEVGVKPLEEPPRGNAPGHQSRARAKLAQGFQRLANLPDLQHDPLLGAEAPDQMVFGFVLVADQAEGEPVRPGPLGDQLGIAALPGDQGERPSRVEIRRKEAGERADPTGGGRGTGKSSAHRRCH